MFSCFSAVFVTGANYYRDCDYIIKIEYVIMRTYSSFSRHAINTAQKNTYVVVQIFLV